MSEERKLKGDLLSSGNRGLATRSSALVRRGLEALRSQSVAQESLITLVKHIDSKGIAFEITEAFLHVPQSVLPEHSALVERAGLSAAAPFPGL